MYYPRAVKFQHYNKGSVNSKLPNEQVRQVTDFRLVTNN
jgi:hypothetical protein